MQCIAPVDITRQIFNQEHHFEIFPNPAANNASLFLNLKENSDVAVSVYSIVGQLVKSIKVQGQQGENNLNIDLANLSSGIYLVKVNVGNATSTKKLIVE